MQIPVLLDRSRREPLTTQLIDQLREAIRQARIPAGARLPSSRLLSEQLEVSRNTVIRAYDTLIVEGYAESRPASGIFVSGELPEKLLRRASTTGDGEAETRVAMPMPSPALHEPLVGEQHRGRLSADFFPGRTSPALFPVKVWRRLLQGNLSHGGGAGLSHYGDPAGLPTLRSAIASHLAMARGIVADPGCIMVVGGAREGVGIAARLFLGPGKLAAVEDPCHQSVALAFQTAGAELASVPVDGDGLNPDALPQRPTALLHVTPSHQFPTGHTLSLTRREAIVAWARRHGSYILEDERDGDFRFDGSPLPAIAATAPDCTIHVGTFSRTLGAGLRLGYMVVPPQLADAVSTAKALLNGGNPWLDQAALAEMMKTGSYVAHVHRLRAHYKLGRDTLLAALGRNFGEAGVSGETGGLHLLWYLPPGVPDATIVENIARRARIGVYALASGGARVTQAPALAERSILLGFGGLSAKQIGQGINRLSDAIDDTIDNPDANVHELFTRVFVPLRAQQRPKGSRRPAAQLDPRVRKQLALTTGRPQRASSAGRMKQQVGTPVATVASIYRYPIKGLSGQPLSSVALEAEKPFPYDRIYALARPGAPIDVTDPQWAKKSLFCMLMLDEGLARVHTGVDLEALRFTAMQGERCVMSANLTDEADRAELEKFFWKLLPTLPAPPTLVRSRGGHFMDKPDNVISLINLATVRSLEEKWGVEIDPLRFRANIYIDGARPWEEFDWVGGKLSIGRTVFTVDRRNGRCGATNVNPVTGRRDLDIPGSLRASFGHKDLGVYLMVRETGAIAVGDTVATPGTAATVRPLAAVAAPVPANGSQRRFICGGCYFIYEEARGLPQQALKPGTPFADISSTWRCPDCGAEKARYRPYLESPVRRNAV